MRDNLPMHMLISHAGALGPHCSGAIAQLKLPNLETLLGLLTPTAPTLGSPDSLTPLAERIRARQLGLPDTDGLIPWAAHDAQQRGLTAQHDNAGWAWISMCHLHMLSNQVVMDDPHDLQLTADECAALMSAMGRYFEEDAITLHPLSNGTMLACGSVFKDLPTASLDRVACTTVDTWTPQLAQARSLRRLQNEMQMLLHTHWVNEARIAIKLPTANAFWVSATGQLASAPTRPPANANASISGPVQWINLLRPSALRDDALAWQAAWQALDQSHLGELLQRAKNGQSVKLSLCGDHQCVNLELKDSGWWSRMQRRFTRVAPHQLIESL
jgi:hypothetical protein